MLITSIDNPKVKEYVKLQQKKYRDKSNKFIVEGMHLVLEAYKKGIVEEVILEQDEVLPLDIPMVYVTKEIICKISTLDHPVNILALCHKIPEQEQLGKRVLLLDDIQDPGNLGTVIRSAVAFDIDTVVLSEKTVDLYNPKVVRATQGMLFHINVIREDLKVIIEKLKKEQIPIYGTRVEYGDDVRKIRNHDSYALIVGNEGQGVSDDIEQLCDANLFIEMNSDVESLNVGVATSILLYELRGVK